MPPRINPSQKLIRRGGLQMLNNQETEMQLSVKNTRHFLSGHRLYHIWNGMIQRTCNTNNKDYKDYGDKGIKVCERWKRMENFVEDMYPTFKEGLTIDRIDNNGNYEHSNCRWATYFTQARNKRKLISTNKSGYRGVYLKKNSNKWRSRICVNGKYVHLGYFEMAIEAAKAYDKYIREHNLENTTNDT